MNVDEKLEPILAEVLRRVSLGSARDTREPRARDSQTSPLRRKTRSSRGSANRSGRSSRRKDCGVLFEVRRERISKYARRKGAGTHYIEAGSVWDV